jgi:hypothetical protein
MSVTLSCVCIRHNLLILDDYCADAKGPYNWLIFYVCGVIAGFTGLVSSVIQSWEIQTVALVTEIFGGIAGILAVGFVCCVYSMLFDG